MGLQRLRDCAQLLPILMLVISLSGAYCRPCPERCTCTFNEYRCANGTLMFLLGANDGLRISCEGPTTNLTCSNFPILSLQFTGMAIINCPSNILMCITDPLVMDQPLIQNLLVFNMSGPLEAEYVRNFTFLQKLEMEFVINTVISTAAINSWRYLKTLELFGGKIQLSENRFNNTSLEDLVLFHTEIDNLHTDVFNGLPNLKKLHLNDINIGNISVGFFKGLNSLEHLKLIRNNLTNIEVGAFLDTPKLQELYVFDNPLMSLPDHVFAGLTSLQELTIICADGYLADGTEFNLGTNAVANLPTLDLVYLKNCLKHKLPIASRNNSIEDSVSTIGNQTYKFSPIIFSNLTSLKTLKLLFNNIYAPSNAMFTNLSSVESIDLCNNEIRELPKNIFHNLTSLIKLDLSDNYIKKLYDGMFSDLMALDDLNLSNNKIEELTLNVFYGLKNLTALNLQNNNIMRIAVLHDNVRTLSPFRHLPNLERMNLNNNKISRIGSLNFLPRLEAMKFANNRFKDMWDFKDIYSKENVTINLSNNYISEVILNAERYWNYVNERPFFLNYINLNGNPIFCDCNNYDLYLCATNYTPSCETHFMLGSSKCSGPSHLKGRLVVELSPSDLVCDLQYVCPDNCSCIFRPATVEVILECSKIPTMLPVFKLDVEKEYYPIRHYLDYTYTLNLKTQVHNLTDLNINTLNLSNIELLNLTFKPNNHLKILDISHNNLTTIPDAILKTNITLYVADNPLECNCSLVEGLKEHRVADYRLVHCANGEALSDINVGRLCAWKTVLFGYICLATMAAIFVIKMAITMNNYMKRKRLTILRILFRRGSEFSINLERNLEIVKEYDLFISFAHQDTEFVRDNLLPKLENEFSQSVCVHHRDWVAGELIEDQIIQSVESARRTVIILTEAFITSEWSYLEFRTAHNMIREGRPRVIIILLNEEIVKDERLSKEIKSYTSVNTYLVWSDPDFWKKLQRILPKHGRR